MGDAICSASKLPKRDCAHCVRCWNLCIYCLGPVVGYRDGAGYCAFHVCGGIQLPGRFLATSSAAASTPKT
jgi:hypothetical protein